MKNILNKEEEVNNYAICTNSIYNQRGLKAPPSAVRNCSNNFKWVKKIDYIKKQSRGGGGLNPAHIGPNPPNKEIINNNNTTSCFNSFERHNPPQWPNIYSCPSKKCNYWAGGNKTKKGGYKYNSNVNLNEITEHSMKQSALPSNAGKYNPLEYTAQIAKKMNHNDPNWNTWMKKHNNYWW